MITIQLTDRAPITIDQAAWPTISHVMGDSYVWGNHARPDQALGQGELDTCRLRVRRHADGRAIVSGRSTAGLWDPSCDSRLGGEIVPPGGDIVAAIWRVADDCGISDYTAQACVAGLPATPLT